MARLTVDAIGSALARFGVDRIEVAVGADARGSDVFDPVVSVGHHTAGSPRGLRPSLDVVTHGRPGLPGPLANTFTDRAGVVVIVATGRANHAGPGGWRGVSGNSRAWGEESESTGYGDWTAPQYDVIPRVHAAHLWLSGRDAGWLCDHREWAPRRKIDRVDPLGLLVGAGLRARTQALLDGKDDGMSQEQYEVIIGAVREVNEAAAARHRATVAVLAEIGASVDRLAASVPASVAPLDRALRSMTDSLAAGALGDAARDRQIDRLRLMAEDTRWALSGGATWDTITNGVRTWNDLPSRYRSWRGMTYDLGVRG